MNIPLERIEGKRFCVVFVKVVNELLGKVQLQCLRGRASIDRGRLSVVGEDGCSFTVPGTAVTNILPNDGTPLLRDAEYFCFVKLDPSIQLVTKGQSIEDFRIHDDDDDDDDCGCGDACCEHHHDH